jgi:hypothetical protein
MVVRYHHRNWIALAVLSCGVAASGSASAACSNATLNGAYGLISSGLIEGGENTVAVYRFTADGNGNVSGSGTSSGNGTIITGPFSATYTVAGNCTGMMVVTNQFAQVSNYNFVFDTKNSQFEFIESDTGTNVSGDAVAIGAATCGFSGKKEILALRIRGHVNSGSPLDVVGQMTLNGSGKLTAATTSSENGEVVTSNVKGTYTSNSDCTGTAQIKGNGFTDNFATVTVNGGKELLLVETDTGTIVAGTATQ